MITKRDFKSNSKRIGREIMRLLSSEHFDDIMLFGNVRVDVSSALLNEYLTFGWRKYNKEINKYLKDCRITESGYGNNYIVFSLEFDDDF